MTIYEELIQRVRNGERFYIDFNQRTMKIGKCKIIDNGIYNESEVLIDDDINDIEDLLNKIECLYEIYKYSTPSERSERRRKCYFKALDVKDLTDEQLVVGEYREVARAMLEGFILCMILENKFVWDEKTMGKWFWESDNDEDLVILKDWIE